MAIQIGSFNFDGPFSTTDNLRNQSGDYVILGRNASHENWNVVDVGESEDVKTRVANHDRAECWKRKRYQQLNVAAYYCDARTRMRIEQELRTKYNPPCGDR